MIFERLRGCAPRRSERGKRYFTGHDGVITSPGGGNDSNRGEKHPALALWRLEQPWPRSHPVGGWLRLLDYQFPLQAGRSDRRVGKVDLLGATDRGRLMVIELKVKPRSTGARGDSPLLALMEGLRYAAVVAANRDVIACEAKALFQKDVTDEPPIVQILAPLTWWTGWLELAGSTRRAAGEWEPAFARLTADIEEGRLGVPVECMALDDIGDGGIAYGADGRTPTLNRTPRLYPVHPSEKRPVGNALILPKPGEQA
ncbi:MAG: hypothetical protein OXL41_14310 [Nitrospinae bacterium]|nr:hypothetical protein [Nitrospinota bacterium]